MHVSVEMLLLFGRQPGKPCVIALVVTAGIRAIELAVSDAQKGKPTT